MHQRILIIFLLFIGAFHTEGQSSDTLKLTVKDAQEIAVKNSKSVVLREIEIAKANQQVKEALSALLPQVNAKLNYTQYGMLPSTIFPNQGIVQQFAQLLAIEQAFAGVGAPNIDLTGPDINTIDDLSKIDPEAVVQFGKKFNASAEIMATQTIFNPVFIVGIKAAKTFIDITKGEKEIEIIDLKDQVKRTYYQALIAEENLVIIERNIDNLNILLESTKSFFEMGFGESIDIDRVRLSMNNLMFQRDMLIRQRDLVQFVLKFQMGIELETPVQLIETSKDIVEQISYEISSSYDPSKRSEIRLMDTRSRVNEYNIKRYKTSYLPSMVFYGVLGSNAIRDQFDFFNFKNPWFNQRYFGFELNIPIWDSFGGKSRVENARLDKEKIDAARSQMIEGYKLEYKTSINSLVNAREKMNFAEENVELAERLYKVTKIKYNEGFGSSLEVNSAERDLYTAQSNYLTALYELLIAKADIEKSLGQE